jgi:hypothetical protein
MPCFSRSAGSQVHVVNRRLGSAAVVGLALMTASCTSDPSPSAPEETNENPEGSAK